MAKSGTAQTDKAPLLFKRSMFGILVTALHADEFQIVGPVLRKGPIDFDT